MRSPLASHDGALFTAAIEAQRAPDYLGALQPHADHAAQPETDAA